MFHVYIIYVTLAIAVLALIASVRAVNITRTVTSEDSTGCDHIWEKTDAHTAWLIYDVVLIEMTCKKCGTITHKKIRMW